MKKECEDWLEEVLAVEQPPSPAAAAHLRTCAACAALRRDAELLVRPARVTVPLRLTAAVAAAARTYGARRRRRRFLLRRLLPAAAAAVLAVVVGIALLLPDRPAESKPEAVALVDWSVLEQESYNLNQEVASLSELLTVPPPERAQ